MVNGINPTKDEYVLAAIEALSEKVNRSNERLEFVGDRLSTIERIEALSQQDLIIAQLKQTCGSSQIRAKIILMTKSTMKRSLLMDTLCIRKQRMTDEARVLKDAGLLYQELLDGEICYRRAPLLQYIPESKLIGALPSPPDCSGK